MKDVAAVQRHLNRVPSDQGGPEPLLMEDGIAGKLTRQVIRDFQSKQFPGKAADARVDVDKRTLQGLNEIVASNAKDWSFAEALERADKLVPNMLARVNSYGCGSSSMRDPPPRLALPGDPTVSSKVIVCRNGGVESLGWLIVSPPGPHTPSTPIFRLTEPLGRRQRLAAFFRVSVPGEAQTR